MGKVQIPNRQKELDEFIKKIFGEHPLKDTKRSFITTNLSDKMLLKNLKSGVNGHKYKKLWEGDTSDYDSQSEADLALCNRLALLSGNNTEQIDKLFRQSGLIRDKWDEMRGEETYGQMTIRKAIEGTNNNSNQKHRPIVEEEAGRLYNSKKKSPITSFIIRPIESITIPEEGETLKVKLITEHKEFEELLFPDCWISPQKFIKSLPAKETTFTGNGIDVQNIRAYLSTFDMAHKIGIRTSGFYEGKFITEEGVLSAEGKSNDVIYLNETKTNCKLISIDPATCEEINRIKDYIDKFNTPTVSLPILGWTVACFFKQIIHESLKEKGVGNGFPLLNIQGEAGSGKTSTMTNILMRIFALNNEHKSIGELTKFTMMKLVDGSNTIPVIFEENKSCMQNDQYRSMISNLIRSTYNCLEGERGRADQTTQIYRYQSSSSCNSSYVLQYLTPIESQII